MSPTGASLRGHFLDPEQAEHRTDGLFRAELRGGGTALLYVLVEHKCYRDPRLGLQLLRYLTRIWERAEAEAGQSGRLPPVIPLVVYHGAELWSSPARFSAMVAAEDAWRPHLLDFADTIVDLGQIADAKLPRMALLRFGLRLLKHVFLGTDPRGLLDEAALAMLRADPDFFLAALRYIMRTYRGADRPVVRELVRRVRPGEEETVMSMVAEELLREGEVRGRAEGRAEGKAETLLRQLRRRFGAVPEAVTTRVQAATTDELDQWLDNFVDAQALEAVFAEPRAH